MTSSIATTARVGSRGAQAPIDRLRADMHSGTDGAGSGVSPNITGSIPSTRNESNSAGSFCFHTFALMNSLSTESRLP